MSKRPNYVDWELIGMYLAVCAFLAFFWGLTVFIAYKIVT